MAGPANATQFNPAWAYVTTGIQTIPLALGADVDLTLSTANGGQTNGYCARAILNGNTAGNLGYYDINGQGPFVQQVAANQLFEQSVSYIVNATTTCNPSAVL